MSPSGEPGRLLVRDLAQVVSSAGSDVPLRGHALGEVEVVGDAYVLCEGGDVAAVGRMRDLPALDGEVEELDGRGLCALPGLVDCHTHACFAGDRAQEFELRAIGASYEELHAAGGGILATVEATRAAGEDGLQAAVRRHRDWMRLAGTTTFESKSGYGLDRETELASLRAIAAEGGVPTWLGAHAVPPEFDDADAYLDFALAEVLPEAARIAEAADVFLERGAFTAEQARRYLVACADAGLGVRLHGDQFTESGAVPLAVELGARSVDHLEATGAEGILTLADSEVVGGAAPGERARPRTADAPGAGTRRRGRGDRPRDRLQSRKLFLREPSARLLPRLHAAPALPGGGARRLHRQRGPRSPARGSNRQARARISGGCGPARCARLALPRLPRRRSGGEGGSPGRAGGLG